MFHGQVNDQVICFFHQVIWPGMTWCSAATVYYDLLNCQLYHSILAANNLSTPEGWKVWFALHARDSNPSPLDYCAWEPEGERQRWQTSSLIICLETTNWLP